MEPCPLLAGPVPEGLEAGCLEPCPLLAGPTPEGLETGCLEYWPLLAGSTAEGWLEKSGSAMARNCPARGRKGRRR